MSCITEILKLKGNKEFLPVHDNCVIEGGGTYNGYEYLITFTSNGSRCGYVALKPEETQRFEDERDETYYYPNLDCHGEITFFGHEHGAKDLLSVPCNDSWVGFDCAHSGDGYDKELTKKYFGKQTFSDEFYHAMNSFSLTGEVIHRTYEYVESECKSIVDQLINKA